jgi:hypothetical protein
VALAGVGVGSFAYHGPQPGWAGFVHDQSIVAFLALLVGHLAWGLRRRGVPTAAAYVAVSAATVVLLVPAGQRRAVPIVLGAALLVGSLACAAIADGGGAGRAWARAWATPAAVFIAAAIAYLVGRTASAFCRPEAWVQPHGAWHVLSAIGLALVANRVVVGRALPA